VAILDQSTVAILDQKNLPVVLNQSTVAILDQSTVAILDTNQLPKAFGHGTMVSGLIHLVAPGAQIMPLRAFQSDGTANLSDVIRAIYYAVDHNARVINMSFSMSTNSPDLQQAVTYATSHGVVLIASAGNEGKELMVYPAAFRGVYGVGSTNKRDLRSPFSNFGDSVRLAAPGEALVTTYPGNNYAAVWGTSFSTALASGAAVLFTSFRPSIRPGNLSDVFAQGPHIGQDVGDSRLDLLPSMQYCAQLTYGSQSDD
jgi:subtilisin family serine protease